MPRTAPSCKTCDQNAKAWEAAAIKLWEAQIEMLLLKDRIAALEGERDDAGLESDPLP